MLVIKSTGSLSTDSPKMISCILDPIGMLRIACYDTLRLAQRPNLGEEFRRIEHMITTIDDKKCTVEHAQSF